jgi:hypothetical protein
VLDGLEPVAVAPDDSAGEVEIGQAGRHGDGVAHVEGSGLAHERRRPAVGVVVPDVVMEGLVGGPPVVVPEGHQRPERRTEQPARDACGQRRRCPGHLEGGDGPGVVADRVGEEQARHALRVAHREDLGHPAAEVVPHEDDALDRQVVEQAAQVGGLRSHRDVAPPPRRDARPVAHHLVGDAAAAPQLRHDVAPQGRRRGDAVEENDRHAAARLLPADLDAVDGAPARLHLTRRRAGPCPPGRWSPAPGSRCRPGRTATRGTGSPTSPRRRSRRRGIPCGCTRVTRLAWHRPAG